ncbi:MAG: Crp/Fnr family transcriptional regulator [Gammaproteobacteria bacterium]|nr:Crp/Fnr family transcriptional regulator [Gammaproteobacteria bacterium]
MPDKKNTCHDCTHARYCLSSQASHVDIASSYFQFPSRLLKKGEHLCYQGEISQNLYIIRAGILKSAIVKKNGDEYIMGFYFPTDLFGWEGIDETHRSISITALDQSNICVVPIQKIFSMAQEIPTMGAQLLKMVSLRIHQDNIALLRTSAQQRVATFLLQLSLRYQKMGFAENYCHLLMTHHDIANYLRMTPNTISRIFHTWQEKKLIRIEKHVVYLLDLNNINLMAEIDSPSF